MSKAKDSMDGYDLCRISSDRVTAMRRSVPHQFKEAARLAAVGLGLAACLCPSLPAQLSVSSSVDLAMKNNPRVKMAQDDVRRALDALEETHDVYIPAISLGANFGQAYGYLPNPPTLFEVSAGSLIYSASQRDYIRSAHLGLQTARLALDDAQQAVAQDTALAYVTLDHDQQRAQAIAQELEYANALVTITQERLDAGQDAQMELTRSKLTAARLRVASLHAGDEVENDRDHLARLIGLPATTLTTGSDFPEGPLPEAPSAGAYQGYANAGIASAFANAEARALQAKGDSKFRFRPQINLVLNYNRYATFTDSFKNLESTYKSNTGGTLLTADEAAFGVQISIPFLDRARAARARQSSMDAAHARHQAETSQIDALDGLDKTRHSITELQAQAEVATLEQQLAQEDLDTVRLQIQSGTGNPSGPQMTPKDEQNARIAERDKYIAVIDASFQVRQAEIQLMRQTGQLIQWLHASGQTPTSVPKP